MKIRRIEPGGGRGGLKSGQWAPLTVERIFGFLGESMSWDA